MEITTIASLIAVIISILSVKEEAGEQSLIKFRLDLLDKKVDKILDKLEQQENETKAIIQEEMNKHILKYHS